MTKTLKVKKDLSKEKYPKTKRLTVINQRRG